MATYQLSLTKEQIDEALSGSHLMLRDPWGFTGNSTVKGDSYSDFSHFASGAAQDFFVVSGDYTGHAHSNQLGFADFNQIFVTGESYIEQLTGRTNIHVVDAQTGYLPYLTGDIAVNNGSVRISGDFWQSGASFIVTGGNGSTWRVQADGITQQTVSGNAVALYKAQNTNITAWDTGQSNQINIEYSDINLKGETTINSRLTSTGPAYFSDEIFLSGVRIQEVLQVTNNLTLTGSATDIFQNKGEILIGTGISGAQLFGGGNHAQFLMRSTGVAGGDAGFIWIDSGDLGGGAGVGLEHFKEDVVTNGSEARLNWEWNTGYNSYDNIFMGLQTKGEGGFWVNTNTSTPNSLGVNAVSLQPVSLTAARTAQGNCSTIAGGFNNLIAAYSSGAFAVGCDNYIRGDYTQIGGVRNSVAGVGAVAFGVNNNWQDLNSETGIVKQYSVMLGIDNSGDYAVGSGSEDETFIENIQIGRGNEVHDASQMTMLGQYNIFNTGESGGGLSKGVMLGNSNALNSAVSVSIGFNNTGHHGANNAILMGSYAEASRFGEKVWSVAPDWQAPDFLFKGQTTDATQTEIFLANQSNKRLVIPTNTSMLLKCIVIARRNSGSESGSYEVTVHVENNSGTITVSHPTPTVILEDDSSWDVTFDADNTNDAVVPKVTGASSKTIDWVIKAIGIEISN